MYLCLPVPWVLTCLGFFHTSNLPFLGLSCILVYPYLGLPVTRYSRRSVVSEYPSKKRCQKLRNYAHIIPINVRQEKICYSFDRAKAKEEVRLDIAYLWNASGSKREQHKGKSNFEFFVWCRENCENLTSTNLKKYFSVSKLKLNT